MGRARREGASLYPRVSLSRAPFVPAPITPKRLLRRVASSQLFRHFLTNLCEPFTLETKAGSTGKLARQTFFDDRVVVKAKRVTLFPETLFSHIDVALPRSQVFPVYPAMQWHLKLVPSTEQVALL